MILKSPKAVPLATVCGAIVGIATAITSPQYVGASLAFMGGLLGGAAVTSERRVRTLISEEQGIRVTACFRTLYELNRGLIDPVQLAFLANVPTDNAHAFLTALAEGTNGEKIATNSAGLGVAFNFPHTANVLEALTKNAQEWATAQTTQLQQDLQQHKQALAMMQLQQQGVPFSKPKEESDPWTPQPGL